MGKLSGQKEIESIIEQTQRRRDEEEGVYHIPTAKRPCRRTVLNYKSLGAIVTPTTITTKAVQKTECRETAERSIRSTVSYMMTTRMKKKSDRFFPVTTFFPR